MKTSVGLNCGGVVAIKYSVSRQVVFRTNVLNLNKKCSTKKNASTNQRV
jgi:hypothetical protein